MYIKKLCFIILCIVSFPCIAQKDVIWDVLSGTPRITARYGSKGINIGGDEDTAPILINNFRDELFVRIQFSLTDLCNVTKSRIWSVKLLAYEKYAPNPFMEGEIFSTTCDGIKEYGLTKSKIAFVTVNLIELRNLTEEKKLAEAEEEKKEREKKALEIAKKTEMEKQQLEKERLANENSKTKTQDDFWTDNTSSKNEQRENNQNTEKKEERNLANTQQQNSQYMPSTAQTKATALVQSYYAGMVASQAQQNLNRLSSLSGNYSSIEELENEFQQNYSQINQEVNSLYEAKNAKLQADATYNFSGGDQTSQTIGESIVIIGGMVNTMKAQEEERHAKEQLQKVRTEEDVKFKAKKKALMVEIRWNLLKQFPDGGMPLSSHKIATSKLYYFSYAYTESTIQSEYPIIQVSNVFLVGKYDDGTWPYKNTVVSDISSQGVKGTIIVVGYFTEAAYALALRQKFTELAKKCGFISTNFTYKGKKETSTEGNVDFWGNANSLANLKDNNNEELLQGAWKSDEVNLEFKPGKCIYYGAEWSCEITNAEIILRRSTERLAFSYTVFGNRLSLKSETTQKIFVKVQPVKKDSFWDN